MHKILDLPLEAVPDNTRALVVFDEFQSIANVKELAALLRSHIQHQRKKASFVFCGSEQGMLEAIFGDPSKPLYTQAAPMRLGGLPASVLEAMIREKFEQTGRGAGDVLATLVTVAAGHPQRAMLLAHQLWVRTPPRKRATQESWEAALTQALKDARPELETVWSVLTANEQRTLRALTNLGSPYEKRASALLELRRSSAHTAVSALARRGIVESDEEGETDGSPALRIVDPLLSEWIRRRFPWP